MASEAETIAWNRAISAACDHLRSQIAHTERRTTLDALERAYEAIQALKR